jgi:hypothetical protein
MFAAFQRLFGAGRAPVPSLAVVDVLPAECATLLAGVSFMDRGTDHEGVHRIVVTVPGGAGFVYGADTAAEWLRKRFGLNDTQVTRALQMLRARFAEYQRQQTAVAVGRGSRWADWRPIHDISEV